MECQPEALLDDDALVGHAELDSLSKKRSIEQRHETRCQPFCLSDGILCDLALNVERLEHILDAFLVLECQCESVVAKINTVQCVFECELSCRLDQRFAFLVGGR